MWRVDRPATPRPAPPVLRLLFAPEKAGKSQSAQMTPTLVNEEALDRFLLSADLGEARRAEAALVAMAASVRMRVVELETLDTGDLPPNLVPVGGG